MNSNEKNSRNDIGQSVYQNESRKFYTLLRDVHTKMFSFNPQRIEAEKTKKRYFNGNVEGINNLYTFINILNYLMENKTEVKGVDYLPSLNNNNEDEINIY